MSFCIELQIQQRLNLPCSPAVQPRRSPAGWPGATAGGLLAVPCPCPVPRRGPDRGAACWALEGLICLRIQTFRKRGLKLMCHWGGSTEHGYCLVSGCSPLPHFASSLSPKPLPWFVPPSSDPQTIRFLGKLCGTLHSLCISLSYEIKCCFFCYPILLKDRAVFLCEEVQEKGGGGAEVVCLPRQKASPTTLGHVLKVSLLSSPLAALLAPAEVPAPAQAGLGGNCPCQPWLGLPEGG